MEHSLVQSPDKGKAAAGSFGILQLVTFKIGEEHFAVDILKVQEINRMTEITKIPSAPSHVEGVVNLRGKVIPIVNLRRKLDLPEKEHDEHSRIMIMEIHGSTMGLIVDGVDEVLRIPSETVEPPPPLSMGISSDYIKGIAKLEDRLIILVDLKSVFGLGDVAVMEEAAEAEA